MDAEDAIAALESNPKKGRPVATHASHCAKFTFVNADAKGAAIEAASPDAAG